MSERVKGATADRSWAMWVEMMRSWTSVPYLAPTDMATLYPDCRAIMDWLEEDGLDGYFFIDTKECEHVIRNGRSYNDIVLKFSNPAAAFNFRMRWT